MKLLPLDRLFSQYIKLRDKWCQRCGGTGGLQTSHFIGRSRRIVRWDEDNACLLCFGCHMYLTAHPTEHVQWFINHLGEEKLDLLMARNRNREKPDMSAITLYLKAKMQEVE